jgi:hypothetical protein
MWKSMERAITGLFVDECICNSSYFAWLYLISAVSVSKETTAREAGWAQYRPSA